MWYCLEIMLISLSIDLGPQAYSFMRCALCVVRKIFFNNSVALPLNPAEPSSVDILTLQPSFANSFPDKISFFVFAPMRTSVLLLALCFLRFASCALRLVNLWARNNNGAIPIPPPTRIGRTRMAAGRPNHGMTCWIPN